jgi:hypothetical protein
VSLLRAWPPFTLCHPLLLRLSLDMVGMECLGPAFARPVSRLMAVLLLPLGECALVAISSGARLPRLRPPILIVVHVYGLFHRLSCPLRGPVVDWGAPVTSKGGQEAGSCARLWVAAPIPPRDHLWPVHAHPMGCCLCAVCVVHLVYVPTLTAAEAFVWSPESAGLSGLPRPERPHQSPACRVVALLTPTPHPMCLCRPNVLPRQQSHLLRVSVRASGRTAMLQCSRCLEALVVVVGGGLAFIHHPPRGRAPPLSLGLASGVTRTA